MIGAIFPKVLEVLTASVRRNPICGDTFMCVGAPAAPQLNNLHFALRLSLSSCLSIFKLAACTHAQVPNARAAALRIGAERLGH